VRSARLLVLTSFDRDSDRGREEARDKHTSNTNKTNAKTHSLKTEKFAREGNTPLSFLVFCRLHFKQPNDYKKPMKKKQNWGRLKMPNEIENHTTTTLADLKRERVSNSNSKSLQNNSVSTQQFHDLHTLDIGRHAVDKGHPSLTNFQPDFANLLTFDPKRKKKKKKKS